MAHWPFNVASTGSASGSRDESDAGLNELGPYGTSSLGPRRWLMRNEMSVALVTSARPSVTGYTHLGRFVQLPRAGGRKGFRPWSRHQFPHMDLQVWFKDRERVLTAGR